MPLPPYIERAPEARIGSAIRPCMRALPAPLPRRRRACTSTPTFSPRCEARQVRHAFVTLHVGAGTFQPVRVDDIDAARDARGISGGARGRLCRNQCRARRRRPRDCGGHDGGEELGDRRRPRRADGAGRARLAPYRGTTRIFIKPGYRFRAVDAMVTNFHLPESTLLMLCAAFVGTRGSAGGLRSRGARRDTDFSATVTRCS